MSIAIRTVNGEEYAEAASVILRESWPPPSIHYTPEYMRWQLSFPSSVPAPAIVALDGDTPVGFCSVTPRRFRASTHSWDSGIVSFVAVRPGWRGRGLSLALYHELCGAIKQMGAPILTFGVEGSIGLKVLLQAYTTAGFQALPLGGYPSYVCLAGANAPEPGDWVAERVSQPDALNVFGEASAGEDSRVILSYPSELQFQHYFRDPRRRDLVLLQNRSTGVRGAAWLVETEFVTANGVDHIASVDLVDIPGYDPAALPALFRAAAIWSGKPGPTLVTAPNLGGFPAQSLRQCGIRQTGKGFMGYCCGVDIPPVLGSARTANIEIV